MKKRLAKILGIVLAGTLLAGCGVTANGGNSSAPSASEPAAEATQAEEATSNYDDVKAEVTLRLSHQMAEEHSINKTALEFARLVKEKCDFVLSIPTYGKINSLNASNAAAVLMYGIRRARTGEK